MDGEYLGWWSVEIDHELPVSEWPLEWCAAYVEGEDEMRAEAFAEAGSGAVSLGYGIDGAYAAANEAAARFGGEKYSEARARLGAAAPVPVAAVCAGAEDDIPF